MLRGIVIFLIVTEVICEWQYTQEANTLDGAPCLTDCIDGRCIVDWSSNTRECSLTGSPAPRFHTSKGNENNGYCFSNCGYFGYEYLWCVTTADFKWDYCNNESFHQTIYGLKCIGRCSKRYEEFHWCVNEQGASQRCALPSISAFQRGSNSTAIDTTTPSNL